MKYKRIGLIACTAALLMSVLAPLSCAEHKTIGRVHQHRQATPQETCTDVDDGGLCTYLPIVELTTGGQTIPGRPIYHDDGSVT